MCAIKKSLKLSADFFTINFIASLYIFFYALASLKDLWIDIKKLKKNQKKDTTIQSENTNKNK